MKIIETPRKKDGHLGEPEELKVLGPPEYGEKGVVIETDKKQIQIVGDWPVDAAQREFMHRLGNAMQIMDARMTVMQAETPAEVHEAWRKLKGIVRERQRELLQVRDDDLSPYDGPNYSPD